MHCALVNTLTIDENCSTERRFDKNANRVEMHFLIYAFALRIVSVLIVYGIQRALNYKAANKSNLAMLIPSEAFINYYIILAVVT